MTLRKIDKMRDKTFDLLLLSSTCNKLRNTEGSCKARLSPRYKTTYKEEICILRSLWNHLSKVFMLPLRKVTKTLRKYVALFCCIVYNVVFCSV